MARKLNYEIRPKVNEWNEVSDTIVNNLQLGSPVLVIMDDVFGSFHQAIRKIARGITRSNVLAIVKDSLQLDIAAREDSQPLPPIHGLIEDVFTKFTVANLLSVVQRQSGLEVDLSIDSEYAQQMIQQFKPLFEEIFPEHDTAQAATQLGDVADRRAAFLATLENAYYNTLPAELTAQFDFATLIAQIPNLDLVLDLDIGALASRINLVALVESAFILTPARLTFWTEYPNLSRNIIEELNDSGIAATVEGNVTRKAITGDYEAVQTLLNDQVNPLLSPIDNSGESTGEDIKEG